MINFKLEAKNIKDEVISIRRHIHENPELGYEEYETSKFIKNFLKKEKISFNEIAGTGVCGIIRGTAENMQVAKVIALRADIDALPIIEKTNLEFKSCNQKMHACGHDAHIAILLGAAKILNKYKSEFSGIIKLIFEPAEETVGGAIAMIEQGVLENPKVDAIIGLHVEETLDYGKIMIKDLVVNAASNMFYITVKGKGGHGAYPHMCVDPIVTAAKLILNLQTIISRELPPVSPAVITVGSIKAGTASNIIPEEVYLNGIIRTMTDDDRKFVLKRVEEIAKNTCYTMNATCDIKFVEGYPCLYNNNKIVNFVKQAATDILGHDNVLEQKYPKLGVESFSYFAKETKAAFYFLGTKKQGTDRVYAAHSPNFDIDENAIEIGVAIQCATVFNYLTK